MHGAEVLSGNIKGGIVDEARMAELCLQTGNSGSQED